MAEPEPWYLQGEYFEQCNCEVSCACVINPVGRFGVTPNSSDGSCHALLFFNLVEGRYGTVDLSGLNAGLVLSSPAGQPMGAGKWSAAVYLDNRATEVQREALETIVTGRAGGPFGRIAGLISQMLGVQSAGIRYERDGTKRSVRIEGVSQVTVEAVPGHFDATQPISINNVNRWHPTEPLVQAVARSSSYRDYGFEWENTGKNSYWSPIEVKGP